MSSVKGARVVSRDFLASLGTRDARLTELMDDPACDKRLLRRTLERFGLINRLVSGWDRVYRSQLRPVLEQLKAQGQVDSHGPPATQERPATQRTVRILDIGCGGGDVLRRVVHLARRDGFEVEALGIDVDPTAIAVAQSQQARRSRQSRQSRPTLPGLTFRQATSSDLVDEGVSFDIVISNHLIHHLSNEEFDSVLADSEVLAHHLCVHSDIARHRGAFAAYALLAAPLTARTFAYVDGLRSIRRSYTRSELTAQLPLSWRVEQARPFRLLAVLQH